jgi:ribosomal protein S27AE
VNVELGDDSPQKAEQEHYYRIAEAAADTLRATCPNSAAGHFWWAAAHGDRTLAQGIPEALLAVPAVIREMERAIDLDPGFPLPYVVLGMLYRDIPAVAGGDWSRSRRYFETGLEQAPNLTLLRLELARLDIREGMYGDARNQLDVLLSTEHPYFESAFVLNDRPEAESLLTQIRGK